MPYSSPNPNRTLASVLVRIFVAAIAVLMVGLVFQTYQVSSNIVKEEVQRTSAQTSTLLQSVFDYKLITMQSQQDSTSSSVTLQSLFLEGKTRNLDFFFLDVEQSEPLNSPDFRFITKDNSLDIGWNDGNSYFYGIGDDALKTIADQMITRSGWYFQHVITVMGDRHLLVRRSPVVAPDTGQVLGQLFIAVVVDNNFTMIEQLKSAAQSTGAIILSGDEVVASSLAPDDPRFLEMLNLIGPEPTSYSKYLLHQTQLKVREELIPLTVVTIQNNSNIVALEQTYLYGLVGALLVIALLGLIFRRYIQKILTNQLGVLMDYANGVSEEREVRKFSGSDISEFDALGHKLETAFFKLREKEKSFQDLFDFSLSPIVVWDTDGIVVQMNPAAKRALKLEQDILLFQKGVDAPESFKNFQSKVAFYIRMVTKGETLMGVNVPIENKIFRWNLSPISLDDGITAVIGQGQDITALIEAEKQSNLARIEAESAATARADFLAKMSHEIRTPLNGILGVSQLLKHSLVKDENREQVEILYRSGEHLLAVLNDILDFSKIEQGKLQLEFSEFSFADFIKPLESIYGPMCEQKGLVLDIESGVEAGTTISGDQVRLNQIVFNLLNNAIKFTASGHVKCRFTLEKTIADKADLHIEVQDTGIGIASDSIEHMFEPFTQAERSTTREYGGSGLGLSIVKNLIDMMGGQVAVDSELGKGTVFYINVPIKLVASDAEVNSPELKKSVNYQLFEVSPQVLLVEDNKSNAFIAKAFLKKYGIDVDWAIDGQSALKILREKTFDLILMDNQMPGMDGVETTRYIRDELKLKTPVFACTADAYESTQKAFIAAGANYIIVKPIKEQPLHQAMEFFKRRYIDIECDA
ncbi:LuxQ periplasmic sensor domain-containing protein [Vibrio sp. SCSIO 43136]|uniref:LuxQ periplasmic sensor domain-containing protein n=1 Tax=Vibrio sp. SCSIO 43136 TaxID=2819101 RepID=UPI002075C6C6|nr:LuxQ periplasmic sensor domain-containing protein [Vibrio sp. SCSIO 43136]USD68017.1 response regulator [Vibrio sp. SCSIO 43136]